MSRTGTEEPDRGSKVTQIDAFPLYKKYIDIFSMEDVPEEERRRDMGSLFNVFFFPQHGHNLVGHLSCHRFPLLLWNVLHREDVDVFLVEGKSVDLCDFASPIRFFSTRP